MGYIDRRIVRYIIVSKDGWLDRKKMDRIERFFGD